jgi:hypothetical protein
MHGWELCLWRLDRYDEAGRVFERMLWLNPSDDQGCGSSSIESERGRHGKMTETSGETSEGAE